MSFADQNDDVPRLRLGYCLPDGLAPVQHDMELLRFPVQAAEDVFDNLIERLMPGIVLGHITDVRMILNDPGHQGPFASIPVSAAAEHGRHLFGLQVAAKLHGQLYGVGSVAIVHDDERLIPAADGFEPARYPAQAG